MNMRIGYKLITFLVALLCAPVTAGPLHDAANNGDLEAIVKLHEQGADLNEVDDFNMSALHFASYSGHENVVEYLLKNHVDVDGKNDGGYTALILSIDGGHTEIAKSLIVYGANTNINLSEKQTPLTIAWNKRQKAIVILLINNGADVKIEFTTKNVDPVTRMVWIPVGVGKCKNTLFHDVLNSNDYDLIKLFLEHGADPNKKCHQYDGRKRHHLTPLEMAESDHVKELLRQYGARGSERSNIWNDFGMDDE